eukprot:1690150-Alexandrium_andersonii.AAC.1
MMTRCLGGDPYLCTSVILVPLRSCATLQGVQYPSRSLALVGTRWECSTRLGVCAVMQPAPWALQPLSRKH